VRERHEVRERVVRVVQGQGGQDGPKHALEHDRTGGVGVGSVGGVGVMMMMMMCAEADAGGELVGQGDELVGRDLSRWGGCERAGRAP